MDIKHFAIGIMVMMFLVIPAKMGISADIETIAYYFHGSVRCPTCHKIEKYIKKAVEKNFKDELNSGLLILKTVNVEEKENEHFVKDYQLYTKSLMLSQVLKGKEIKHKNLTKIWEYVRDENKFSTYVTNEIKDFLKEN